MKDNSPRFRRVLLPGGLLVLFLACYVIGYSQESVPAAPEMDQAVVEITSEPVEEPAEESAESVVEEPGESVPAPVPETTTGVATRPEVEPEPSAFPEDTTVFVAWVRSMDAFFNGLESTLRTDRKALADFELGRDFIEETMTQDGPDFTRPFGFVCRKGPKGFFPIFFVPVTDKLRKLNNIILLPQIFQQVKDEYGPTNRYKVRQDIAVLGGLHYFYWANEQLYAEERNGWIWVTTEEGFSRLPNDPMEAVPDKKYRTGEIFWARLEKNQLTDEEKAQLQATADAVGKQWIQSTSDWHIPTMIGKRIQELSEKQSRFIHDSDIAEVWLCQELATRIQSDLGPSKTGAIDSDFIFTRRSHQKKSNDSFRRVDRKYRLSATMISWCLKAALEYDTAAEEQHFGPILEIPREIFDIEF